jgi:hypothetical protein
MTIEELREELEAERLRAMVAALRAARRTLTIGMTYKQNGDRDKKFPPPKTSLDAQRYAEMREAAWTFIRDAHKIKGMNGKDEAPIVESVEELALLSGENLDMWLATQVKGKKLSQVQANELRTAVHNYKRTVDARTRKLEKRLGEATAPDEDCPI